MMHILLVSLVIDTGECLSLKGKRAIVKGYIGRIKNKFNISIAEIDSLNSWHQAELGITAVSNSQDFLGKVANKIEDHSEKIIPGRVSSFDFVIVNQGEIFSTDPI